MPKIAWGETIDVVRNRDWPIDFEIEDADGNPVNISGSTGHRLTVKVNRNDPDAKALIDQTTGVTLTDAVNGKLTVLLPAASTNDAVKFPNGQEFPCELYYVDSAGKKTTAFWGAFAVWDNVFKGA